jgi:hypothetical protein
MQRLFADEPMVRHMVDLVPESEPGVPPMMVLEPFQKTLWDARTTRPFSTREIKWIMKGVLLGIMTIHRKGLVYTGLPSPMLLFLSQAPTYGRSQDGECWHKRLRQREDQQQHQ